MFALDKLKIIDKDSLQSLFKLFDITFQDLDKLLEYNIEISSFYLHTKLQTMREAIEIFQTENKLLKK